MAKLHTVLKKLNNFETVFCEILLACFVTLLFAQIIARQVFNHSLAWSEELSTYMFVWFAYFGAVVATKMAAHNRVTFQFKYFPPWVGKYSMILADLIWVVFNVYFVYLSYQFIFVFMNAFWKSQTLGVPMKYLYMVLPIAFSLMTIRILVNLYATVFMGVEQVDPETAALQKLKQEAATQQA
jgi:TRAP-type C4-dicarboxylate transport system permease small subunit